MADINFELGPYELRPIALQPSVTSWAMVTGEIGELSNDGSLSPAPCTAEIIVYAPGQNAPCTGEIAFSTINPPLSPIAAHLNQGRVLVSWGYVDLSPISHFEIYASLIRDSGYELYANGISTGRYCLLTNLPLGTTVYFKVRAVGKNGMSSIFVSAKRGKFQPIEGLLKVTGISGSTIEVGAEFSIVDSIGYAVTFAAVDSIVIP